jgi:Carboxypeptidase regulatory-like domain
MLSVCRLLFRFFFSLLLVVGVVQAQTGTALRQWLVASGQWLAKRRFFALFSAQGGQRTTTRVTMSLCRLMYGMVAASLILFLLPSTLPAQTGTATLSGIVTDEGGAIVPNCEIQLQSVARGNVITTKTNNDGIYVFPAVQPGSYNLTIKRSGFKQVDFLDLLLNTQDHVQQNFRLQVGSVSESVTVNASDVHTETTSSGVGLLVDRTFVENMPLNGRSFQDLISLAPGLVVSISQNQNGLFSVDGQRVDANYFTVDGVAANVNGNDAAGVLPSQTALGTTQSFVSVDALQEFRVQTSTYSAEYGRQPGGQIQLTTRSGTNEFHGSLFDYFRNEALDANNWFYNANVPPIPRLPERQNDFGGTLGGPVRIPWLYNGKDKTFFFFSYEGLRLRVPNYVQEEVPSLSLRSAAAPAVQPFIDAYPVPNGTDYGNGTALFSVGQSNPSSLDAYSLRIDHALGQTVQLFGRLATTPSNSISNYANFEHKQVSNNQAATVGLTAKFTENLFDEFRFNYSSSHASSVGTLTSVGGAVPYPPSLLLPPQYLTPGELTSPTFYLYLTGTACCQPLEYLTSVFEQHQFNLVDSLSWTIGKHVFKFGVDYRRLSPLLNNTGYYTYAAIGTIAGVENGVADDGVGAQSAIPNIRPVFKNFSAYVQDAWHATNRLTVNYGLRWEFNPVPGEVNGLVPATVIGLDNFATMQLAPQGTELYRNSYKNFAPRIGLAYQLVTSASHPLLAKAGFGIFYDTAQNQWATAYSSSPPFQTCCTYSPTAPFPIPATALAPPPTVLTAPYGALFLYDPNLRLPYTEQWNLSLSQGLGTRNTLTASYVGNGGRRLLNTQGYDPGAVNPNFTSLYLTDNAASSSYNSLQVQDSGYIAPGLQTVLSWTWAHAIDDASADNTLFNLIRGNSDNDVRNTLQAAINYQISGARTDHGWLASLTRGWLAAFRISAFSGNPVNPISAEWINPSTHGQEQTNADFVPGVPVYLHNVAGAPGGWQLNPKAFTAVPVDPNTGIPLREGTVGRNFLHGPTEWQINTSIERTFPLHEGLQLKFRADAFNVLNHPNFSCVDLAVGDPNFGKAQCTYNNVFQGAGLNPLYQFGGPRSLQLSLKLAF